ncbi:hypothetical protein EV363DRAFT_1144011, partial [Boletus edulis]
MRPLPPISAYPPTAIPAGYGWGEHQMVASKKKRAFKTGIDARDRFLGQRRCVICGNS